MVQSVGEIELQEIANGLRRAILSTSVNRTHRLVIVATPIFLEKPDAA